MKDKMIIKALIFFILISLTSTINANEVKICDDKGEWAPFSYFERINGVPDKTKLTGAVTELLDEVFKIVDLPHSIDMIPWKRCTNSVSKYEKLKKYEVFINGSYNKERAKKYHLSDPIYTTNKAVFYSKEKYPNGILENNKLNINKFKVCDVHGYNTEFYFKKLGLNKDTKIDQGGKTIISVLQKIDKKRCDMIIVSQEPVYGGVAVGKYKLPESIRSQIVTTLKPTNFHMFISKGSSRADELLEKINKAIKILKNNGVYDEIFSKYLPKN